MQNLQKKYEISENNLFPLYKNLDMSLKRYPALNMVLQIAHRDYKLFSRTFKHLHCHFQGHLCWKIWHIFEAKA